jgi:hypothetical protein
MRTQRISQSVTPVDLVRVVIFVGGLRGRCFFFISVSSQGVKVEVLSNNSVTVNLQVKQY